MFTNKSEIPSKVTTTNSNTEEKTYLLSLPPADGTSRIIISSEQLTNLSLKGCDGVGLNHTETNGVVIPQDKPDNCVNIVYKIIKPEDLDLKPTNPKYLPRGRPRKKLCVKKNVEVECKKVIKQSRTRSGRITKPPKHIETDFKRIDITDDSDLKTVEFEPLKTNDAQVKQEPLLILEQHSKKRNIPPRYRCPTCNKAYLGKAKILTHFEKHPDHGSTSTNIKYKNTATWDFLILTAQKFKGSKIVKFCEELLTLLENAKKIAKYLFKPVHDNEQGYFINDQLATLFGIGEGSYRLDEAELFKDINLCQYLETNVNNSHDNLHENIPVEGSSEKTNKMDVLNNHLNNHQTSLALVKYEMPKLFNFSTPAFPGNVGGIELPSTKVEESKCLEEKKEIFHHLQKEMALQNELHDVDELMLENVDTGQVNILETSSNSDDIMNVDQFVNERFKKLTEPDIDIHTNSLNLELPPLDIFQFHTS